MKAAIIIASTAIYRGQHEDKTGPIIERMIKQVGFNINFMKVLPGDKEVLSTVMERLADTGLVDVIFTIGGTGLKAEDCTPEATKACIDRELPGVAEAMRVYSMRFTKRTMLTRSVAGLRGNTIIVNLPGSPKAAKECLEFVLSELVYGVEVLNGQASDGNNLEI